MPYTVTLIPGDGTGPELAEATRRVIDATGVKIDVGDCPCRRGYHGTTRHAAAG